MSIEQEFAKLQAKLALNKVMLCQNPLPYIERQHRQIAKLMVLLHEVEMAMAMTSDAVFNAAINMGVDPNYFNGAERVKLNAVQAAIDKYYKDAI